MAPDQTLEIFLAVPPGLEPFMRAEAEDVGFHVVSDVSGGVVVSGGWPDVWRANLSLRGASRVLVRVAQMRSVHLAQLDKQMRRIAWHDILGRDIAVRIDATCKRSRLYHSGAVAQRIGGAIRDSVGAVPDAEHGVRIFARIENNLCTVSVDTSGELLHKRGNKEAVGKAPMRETLAALFLRACDYRPGEPVVDPMCGSGTFVIEAAERALGLAPGRHRSFAFEHLAGFDPVAWEAMRREVASERADIRHWGSDRDAGAMEMSRANAERAGVATVCTFRQQTISDLGRPDGPPGLVMVNPPYGERIGDPDRLRALYARLGDVLRERFAGWRVGLVTSDRALAQATRLPFEKPGPPVPHGGLRVRLYRTGVLV